MIISGTVGHSLCTTSLLLWSCEWFS